MRSYMAIYHFETQDALDYGIDGAIMLYNLCFWMHTNKANNKNFHNGRYWTYNSARAFAELFPFWSKQKIGRILRGLESDGAIVSSNFNKAGYDKTKWYSVLKSACLNSNNGIFKSEQPIPDNKPDNKQHIYNNEANASESEIENKSNQKPLSSAKEVVASFERAWIAYGRKGNKQTALRYWKKLSSEDRDAIQQKIPSYIASKEERCYIKDFQGWINPANRMWEDLIVTKKKPAADLGGML